jgi:hypothetical protein
MNIASAKDGSVNSCSKRKSCLVILGVFSAILLLGCQSPMQRRIDQNSVEYQALNSETSSKVDQGQIAMGMSESALKIAWGDPVKFAEGEDSQGHFKTWYFQGSYWKSIGFWEYRYFRSRRRYAPTLDYRSDRIPKSYIQAKVRIRNGFVEAWERYPQPLN